MTLTTAPTARDVVAKYLEDKAKSTKPAEQRERIAAATREIVGELPDGFSYRDVRACVGELIADDTAELTASRIGRTVTKTLNGMVSDGRLSLDSLGTYAHRGA